MASVSGISDALKEAIDNGDWYEAFRLTLESGISGYSGASTSGYSGASLVSGYSGYSGAAA